MCKHTFFNAQNHSKHTCTNKDAHTHTHTHKKHKAHMHQQITKTEKRAQKETETEIDKAKPDVLHVWDQFFLGKVLKASPEGVEKAQQLLPLRRAIKHLPGTCVGTGMKAGPFLHAQSARRNQEGKGWK